MVPCSISRVNCQKKFAVESRRDVEFPQVVFTQDVEFTHNVEFTCDGNMTFLRDAVVLTKLSNWLDSSCL